MVNDLSFERFVSNFLLESEISKRGRFLARDAKAARNTAVKHNRLASHAKSKEEFDLHNSAAMEHEQRAKKSSSELKSLTKIVRSIGKNKK